MQADGRDILMIEGLNGDVLTSIAEVYQRYRNQPAELVQQLRCGSIDATCEAIFGYLVEHVRYKLDPPGVQLIKTPARLLADKQGDCKSLAMFINCCLHCAGVKKHAFRFVNFDGGNQYSHVYAVAWDESGNEILLDPCETDEDGVILMDYARPWKKKKDIFCD